MEEPVSRIDSEWIALNAFRGITRIASKGDMTKSSYENALNFGGELYPELLGPDVSVLRRDRESDIAKEYRQRAILLTIKRNEVVDPINLIEIDINEIKDLLSIAEKNRSDRARVDQLKKKLAQLASAEQEMKPASHSENQLIFRDAYNVDRNIPSIRSGKGWRDFELPDSNILRVRVLHPDVPEHVTGSDIIYERHNPLDGTVSIVAVQYKIWSDKTLRLTDRRMMDQIERLRKFLCCNGICDQSESENDYRFPCCAAFLRPTDKLQKTDQRYFSSGEHLPICRIESCKTETSRGTPILEYKKIKDVSLNSEMFEYLFNKGKIGSKAIDYLNLQNLYANYLVESSQSNVVIYVQEFSA
ncbi:hypothetical protein [Comamonas sp. lk]|uniref:hypothetical protein n=1 Tax=Comamonas sp. lk TaxID=2201272 RepID=UPI000EAD9C91|nr:hypothetical protein [Comamonas sp. lk]